MFSTKENFVENTPYSVYAYNDEKSWDRTVNIRSNFDAGDAFGIKEIVLTESVIAPIYIVDISTHDFATRITININNRANVIHYGYSGIVTIKNCYTYYEYGTVGKINISNGDVYASYGSNIFQINNLNSTECEIDFDDEAIIYNSNGEQINTYFDIEEYDESTYELLKNTVNFDIKDFYSVDEFTCTHDLYEDISELVNGNYVICKKCGNTLIKVEDEAKNITYNSVFGYEYKQSEAYIIEMGAYKYNELPIENCKVWPLNKILSCKHDYVLENCVREVNSSVDICESLVTDYFKCSKCEKEIVKEHQTGHLLNSDQTHCSREEYGCTYNLEHEGYTNIININNSKYVLNTDELYSKPSIIQEDNSYYLCFSKGLESSNDSINVYRLTFKDNTIYVYAEIVKSETPDNIETIKSIKIKNYNGATNGTNNVAINNETKIVVIYK